MAVTVKQEVAALYSAIFNRAPDQAGLEFWVEAINGGDSLTKAAEGFTQHPVFAEVYGDLSNQAKVEALYTNVLGSAGDAAGIQFWVAKLESGVSFGQVVAEFVSGALTIDLDALLDSGELSQADYDAAVVRQNSITNKADAGVYFADTFGAASNLSASTDTTTKEGLESDPVYLASQAAIAGVTNDAATLAAAKAAIDAAEAPTDLLVAPAFTLTEALALEELPEIYSLSDADANFADQTVAGLADSIALANEIIAGATNAAELELNATYTLADTLENLTAAEAAVLEGAASYSLTDEAGDLGSLTEEQIALVEGATNAPDFTYGTIGETFTLTEALEDLAAANAAKTTFLEGLELDTDLDGTVDVEAGDATEANVAALLTSASSALSGNTFTTLSPANYEDATKTALQDADIATAVTDATKAVTTATKAAPEGATALLEAVSTQVEALEAQLKAEHKAQAAYAEEVTAFQAINSVTVGTSAGNLDFVDGEFGVSDGSGALSAVYATQTKGVWTLTTAGKTADLARTADLFAKYDATVTANDATTAAKTALENAVEEVLLSEFDGHSVKDFGNVIAGVTPSANPTVAVNLDAGDAVVYDTAADAAAGDGTKEEFTATFAAVADGETVIFDGVTYTAASSDGDSATKAAAAFASAYNAGSSVSWDAVDNGNGTVTFTAKAVGNVTNVTTAGFTGATGKVTDVAINVEGVAAGSTTTITSTTTKVQDLKDALDALTALNEAVADFEAARELSTELATLNEAITDATSAITDSVEDGGLGINLLPSTATTFTSKDDVFLFTEGTNKSLAGFGVSGEDKIFFGEEFTLVAIADGKAITDNVGDAAALEILWAQQGNNLVLYVEEETFAGNSSAGAAADITTITLTGVNAADVSFEGGFLTIA